VTAKQQRVQGLAVVVFLFVGFGFFTAYLTRQLLGGIRSEKWEQTEGTLKVFRGTRRGGIRVEYSYRAGTNDLIGTQLHYARSKNDIQDFQAKIGGPVVVYVNPAEPSESVLLAGVSGSYWLFWGLFAASTLAQPFLGILIFKHFAEPPSESNR
jgi:hypothetical protein